MVAKIKVTLKISETLDIDFFNEPQGGDVEFYVEKIEGLVGTPGMIPTLDENPNGGSYIYMENARKPSRFITLTGKLHSRDDFALYQATEIINSLSSLRSFMTFTMVAQYPTGETVTTVINDVAFNSDLNAEITGFVTNFTIPLVAKTGNKTVTVA